MTRQEAIEDGGFVWLACIECGKEFWADDLRVCEMCRVGRIEDDERRHDEEVEILDWESLLDSVEERWITQKNCNKS